MLYRLAYIICWSLGLLYATFPHFFDGEMTFDIRSKTMADACDYYIFPFTMVMVLFLLDVNYGYVKEKLDGQYTNVIGVISCLIVFLLGFVFSIYFVDPLWARICFIISWLSLSVMKLLKTDPCVAKKNSEIVKIPTD